MLNFATLLIFMVTLCYIKKMMDCDVSPILVGKTVCFSIEFACSFESDELCWASCWVVYNMCIFWLFLACNIFVILWKSAHSHLIFLRISDYWLLFRALQSNMMKRIWEPELMIPTSGTHIHLISLFSSFLTKIIWKTPSFKTCFIWVWERHSDTYVKNSDLEFSNLCLFQ